MSLGSIAFMKRALVIWRINNVHRTDAIAAQTQAAYDHLLVEGDTIRATVVPQKASDTEDNALTTPLAITGKPRNPLQKFHHLGSTAPYSRKAIYTMQIH